MKAAQQVVEFYQKKNLPVPDEHTPQETFYRNEKSIIERRRCALWPLKKTPLKPYHPPRWTGSPNLVVDIEKADRLHRAEIEKQMGCSLEEYYRTRYRQLSWQIHSGVAGSWNVPSEGYEIMVGLALKDCGDLAMLCTQIVLTDFGFRQALPDLPAGWDDVTRNRMQAYADKMDIRAE